MRVGVKTEESNVIDKLQLTLQVATLLKCLYDQRSRSTADVKRVGGWRLRAYNVTALPNRLPRPSTRRVASHKLAVFLEYSESLFRVWSLVLELDCKFCMRGSAILDFKLVIIIRC